MMSTITITGYGNICGAEQVEIDLNVQDGVGMICFDGEPAGQIEYDGGVGYGGWKVTALNGDSQWYENMENAIDNFDTILKGTSK